MVLSDMYVYIYILTYVSLCYVILYHITLSVHGVTYMIHYSPKNVPNLDPVVFLCLVQITVMNNK